MTPEEDTPLDTIVITESCDELDSLDLNLLKNNIKTVDNFNWVWQYYNSETASWT